MNPLIYVTLISLRSHSDKEKIQDLKSRITQALEITNQKHTLKIAFPLLENEVFGFLTDLRVTLMRRKVSNFVTKNCWCCCQ